MTNVKTDYNGWANRETWLINLHFSPQTISDIDYIKEQIIELENSIKDSFLKDDVNFGLIDWQELKNAMEQ